MSVIAVVDPERAAERGWDNPQYPIAIWQVSGLAVGDGGGGTIAVQINLKSAGVTPGNAFSLEDFWADLEGNPTLDALELNMSGMEVYPPLLVIRRVSVPLIPNDGAGADIPATGFLTPRLFLGRGAGPTAGTITVRGTEPGAGNDLRVVARGYIWDPRSVLTGEGGYRRPPDGQFPN